MAVQQGAGVKQTCCSATILHPCYRSLHVPHLLWQPASAPTAAAAASAGPLQEMKRFQSREAGYQKIQSTKPQTLAYALQVHRVSSKRDTTGFP